MANYCGMCFQEISAYSSESVSYFEHIAGGSCRAIQRPSISNVSELGEDEYGITLYDSLGYPAYRYSISAGSPDVALMKAVEHVAEDHANWNEAQNPVKCTCSFFSAAGTPQQSSEDYPSGHLYLVKTIDPRYQAYKIGISGFGESDDRLLTHLALGWQIVALWEVSSEAIAIAVEQEVLKTWRTHGLPVQLKPKHTYVQGGWTETVGIESWKHLLQNNKSLNYPAHAKRSLDDMAAYHVETIMAASKTGRGFAAHAANALGISISSVTTSRIIESILLKGGVKFMNQMYQTPVLAVHTLHGPVVNTISGGQTKPPLLKLVSAPQTIFPPNSGARAILMIDVISALTVLQKQADNPVKDGFNTNAIFKMLLTLPQGKKYETISHYLHKSISSVLNDTQIQKALGVIVNKTSDSGNTSANAFWRVSLSYALPSPVVQPYGIVAKPGIISTRSAEDLVNLNLIPSNNHFSSGLPFGKCTVHAAGHLPNSSDYSRSIITGPWASVLVKHIKDDAFEFAIPHPSNIVRRLYNHNPELINYLLNLVDGAGVYAIINGSNHYVKIPLPSGGHMITSFSAKPVGIC